MIGRDFYSVIYAIEGSRRNEANNDNNDIRVYKDEDNLVDNTNVMVNEDKTNAMDNIELLQLAYYMINDLTRVKAFNIKNNRNNNMNLFYDFLLNKNYSAARECLKEIQNGSFSLKRQTNLLKMDIFKEIVEGREMDYNFIEDFSKEMVLHLIKDLEILQNINISNIDNIDNMCNIDN